MTRRPADGSTNRRGVIAMADFQPLDPIFFRLTASDPYWRFGHVTDGWNGGPGPVPCSPRARVSVSVPREPLLLARASPETALLQPPEGSAPSDAELRAMLVSHRLARERFRAGVAQDRFAFVALRQPGGPWALGVITGDEEGGTAQVELILDEGTTIIHIPRTRLRPVPLDCLLLQPHDPAPDGALEELREAQAHVAVVRQRAGGASFLGDELPSPNDDGPPGASVSSESYMTEPPPGSSSSEGLMFRGPALLPGETRRQLYLPESPRDATSSLVGIPLGPNPLPDGL
ncbi:hypothetical protein DFJ74DRAFT_458739 [Hyaloraphidium curvatum]|nr:hypothetical protein DFJ74DRAFT_458739 [Hyaloraphidium curvatum]